MKRKVISRTLVTLALASTALFAGVAQADSARIHVGFGDYCPPVARFQAPLPQSGHAHPAAWHDGRHRHDGFGPASHVDQRQRQQHQRIVQGVRSGELTPHETRELRREQHQIRAMERHFWRNDGRLTADEWRRLEHAQDRASHHIWQEKHDYQARY
jgi:hypothetical protein